MIIDDEELRNLYKISSEEHLQRLEAGLLHVLDENLNDETLWEELRREAHSLKGDSRSLGLESVEVLSHQIEKILLDLKQQQISLTLEVSDSLFQGLNAIGLLIQEALTGQQSGINTDHILEQLMAIILAPEQPKSDLQLTTFIQDEELRNLYKISSEEHLQKLETGLLSLLENPDDTTRWEELRREVHSLKGDARSVELETVEVLSHQIEEILLGLKRQQIAFSLEVSICLFEGLQAISLLVQEAVTGQPSGINTDEILTKLMAVEWQNQQSEQEFVSSSESVPQTLSTLEEDEEILNAYKIYSQEHLQNLETGLLLLERRPDNVATLEHLLREAHSLKGDSRSIGLETVEALTHQVEEILLAIKRQEIVLTLEVSDRLFQGLDAISRLIQEALTGQPSGIDTAQILNRLTEVVSTSSPEELLQEPLEIPLLPTEISVDAANQENSLPLETGSYNIETIRVETRHLDALMVQAEELTFAKISIDHVTSEIEEIINLWEDCKAFYRQRKYLNSSSLITNPYQEHLEKGLNSLRHSIQENKTRLDILAEEFREKIRTLRLLPLSTIFQLFPRMVRDLARLQSKEVELIIDGGETTADKNILEEIKDSLMHMIRNAVDHGIETPSERKRLGKPPVATIWLRGYQTPTHIVIEVADDGQGLDIEKIKQTALKRGLFSAEELANMTPSQIHALILSPGFSTRTFITEISGRGIGLDVVRTKVEKLKGNIQIESTYGKGSTFRIELSTTLTVVNVLLIEVQGSVYALPIESVQTTLLVSQEQIFTHKDTASIALNGQDISIANLADLLEFSNPNSYTLIAKVEQQKSQFQPCILLKVAEEQAGFLVDRLLGTQEVVIKPQSQLLKRVRNITGATILPSGEVCMILNPSDLLKSLQQPHKSSASMKSKETVRRKPVILLVEDSVPVRTQEQRLLEKAGYEVVVAVDGLDGYNKLTTRDFDAVLSDIEMPNLDGLSLTAKIRQHQEYSKLPIILVTTLNSDADKKRGAEAGADAYIMKGKFNQNVLLEILAKLV
jgi:two-component system chemotaxis sensor kinase CheA